jgi:hypothetical protein
MKKTFLFLAAAALLSCCDQKKTMQIPSEDEMGAYIMVYHKDADHSLHMALSYDSYTWTALNDDKPIIAGDTIAMQKGIRDPHIFRGPDGGFYLAMTDLHIFANNKKYEGTSIYRDTQWERDGASYGWGNNRGLVMMKSFDLINWTRTNLNFSELTCPTGVTDMHGNPIPWSEVGCVWAPETVYDEEKGQLLVHFTTRMKNGTEMIYYIYMNEDFTQMLTEPRLLFEAPYGKNNVPAYTVIDSDIIKIGDTYHLFYVSHEGTATVKHATSQKITGPYVMDDKYDDGEPQGHEAPNCWKRLGQDTWVVMFDNYNRHPHNFGFVETNDFQTFRMIGYFDGESSPMKRTNFAEQKHAAVAPLTVEEAKKLEEFWNNKK